MEVINEAKSICLLTNQASETDSVATMMAFYHLFKNYKKIRVVVPEEVPSSCHSLPESSIIEKDLGPKKLAISLDTNGVSLEKISYLQEGRTFKLIVHPERRSFEVERISYEYLGYSFDLFFFIGVHGLSEVAPLFNYDFSELSARPSINLDVRSDNELFGSINLVDPTSVSVCEMFFKMLGSWKINFSREVSLCLLTGLANSPNPKDSLKVFPEIKSSYPDLKSENGLP